ncbi:MAG: SoxR reducing system RseC family protein [Bacteroidales bacterium]|nr:SoxR reducing system RseC family protein [Bacteroidales bacterium]
MGLGSVIRHKGIITGTNPLKAEILTESACASCHARGYCSLSEKKRKEITRFQEPEGWEPYVGQEVCIEMRTRLGFKALWYGMGLPAVILGVAITCGGLFRLAEWLQGLIAIMSIGIYYFVLYLLKDRIQNDFYFTVHNIKP